ncbi:unnamed protein product [Linum trigynum]|uniref:Uncharacterized protein n=1 Tax=Linum trigynum TaxID=586398 RepID=A0AAV2GUB9_9ROSI
MLLASSPPGTGSIQLVSVRIESSRPKNLGGDNSVGVSVGVLRHHSSPSARRHLPSYNPTLLAATVIVFVIPQTTISSIASIGKNGGHQLTVGKRSASGLKGFHRLF